MILGDMLADTPMAKIDDIEFVRTVAVARISMPIHGAAVRRTRYIE
jgi:biotin synthase